MRCSRPAAQPRPPDRPFLDTSAAFAGDTSIDTSINRIQDESDLTEPHDVLAIWGSIGRDTQGPAGAPIPLDLDSDRKEQSFEDMPDVADTSFGYEDDTEAPEDARGPHPRLGHLGSFTIAELSDPAALAAANAGIIAHKHSTSEMLDILDAAEASYFEAASPKLFEPKNKKHDERPSAELRAKVIAGIAQVLEKHKHRIRELRSSEGSSLAFLAAQCEQKIYDSTKSLVVYQSAASNAIRVAAQVESGAELVRVALGGPKVPEEQGDLVLHDLSGLQSIAVKVDRG